MIVVGIDASLTGMGLATVGAGEPYAEVVGRKGKRSEPLEMRAARQDALLAAARRHIITASPDLVAIEAPAFGTPGGSTWDRAGLWWGLIQIARGRGVPVVEIAPRTRALYATGDGNAGKPAVLSGVQATLSLSYDEENMIDATVLALIGARWLGSPIDGPLQAHQTRAMASIAWPTMKGRTA